MPIQMHPETAVGHLKAGSYTFPLQAVDFRGTVRGLLYSAVVTQKFRNDRDTRMEAVYVFPLPPKAAVHNFTLTIGDRVVEGEIKERGQARRDYQEAVQSGHRAALMEEERSDIFTTTVGNIGPGEEVTIKFELSGPLSCFKNTARLRMPLVVGEVYIPGQSLQGNSVGDGVTNDTDQVPDASRITPPRLADGAPNPVALSVSFDVEPAGLQVNDVVSTCHFARCKKYKNGKYKISLLPGVERMDKAFVLEITYPKEALQTSLLVDEEKKTFALTVVPPVAPEETTYPRDVVILLDRSGSMSGWNMVAARRAAARIIESLNAADRFGLVAYDNRNDHFDFKNGLCVADNFHKMRAAEWLSKIEARGGTEALPALREGMQYFSKTENRDPHVILITDGDVGNDSALIRSCQTGIRISTVGIGYAAREGLLNRMAETSGGVCSLIPNESDLERELVEMHRKWGQPVWKGLSLAGQDERFRSPKFWDVWRDIPTTFFGRLDELPNTAQVTGWLQGRGQFSVEVEPLKTEDPVVYRSWARARLLDLEDLFLVNKAAPAELVDLSISAQVLCRFTAFCAVDKAEKVNTEQKLERAVQPVEPTIQKKRKPVLGSRPSLSQSLRGKASALFSKPALSRPRMSPGAPPPPPAPAPSAASDLGMMCFDDSGGGGDEAFLDASLDMEVGSADLFSAEPECEPLMEAPAAKREIPLPTKLKQELAKDNLLTLGDDPETKELRACLVVVESVVKSLTEALRLGKLPSHQTTAWKELLSRLLDYQDALQDLLEDEGDLVAARNLRKELDSRIAPL